MLQKKKQCPTVEKRIASIGVLKFNKRTNLIDFLETSLGSL